MSIKQIVLTYITVYLLGINLAGFISMFVDKQRARRKVFRISELTLLLFAIFGGSIGSLLGMQVFRHKTQKPLFYIGIPVILLIQLLVVAYFLFFSRFTFRIM